MKTYIAFAKENGTLKMVAIEANNKMEAYTSLKSKGFKVGKLSIRVSSCHIDYVSCEKAI